MHQQIPFDSKLRQQLPHEIVQFLEKQRWNAWQQAEHIVNKMPHVTPENLLHALRDLLNELTTAAFKVEAERSEIMATFNNAYLRIMGELDQMDMWSDPELWIETCPVILRRIQFALQCLSLPQGLGTYSEVFQEYCKVGGVGKLSYEQALTAFAKLMKTDVAELPEDDETVIALQQLRDLRDGAQAIFVKIPDTIDYYAKSQASFKRLMEILSFECLLAFPIL